MNGEQPDPDIALQFKQARQLMIYAGVVQFVGFGIFIWSDYYGLPFFFGMASFVVCASLFYIVSLLVWRCPSCNGHLGIRINPRFCVHCGVSLRGGMRQYPEARLTDRKASEEFHRRRRLQVLVFVGGLVLFVVTPTMTGAPWLVFLIVPAVTVFTLANWRCPVCHRFLGWIIINEQVCQKCGARFREAKEPPEG